jgi:hypothetical protein
MFGRVRFKIRDAASTSEFQFSLRINYMGQIVSGTLSAISTYGGRGFMLISRNNLGFEATLWQTVI